MLRTTAGVILVTLVVGTAALVSWATLPVDIAEPSREIEPLVAAPCDYRRYSLELYNVYSDPNFPDLACGSLTREGIRLENFWHRGPFGRYRITYVKRSSERVRRFVIYLVGGPRLPTTLLPQRALRAEPPVALAWRRGTGVLAPDYLGTFNRSLYPRHDVPAATREVVDLIDRLNSTSPDIEVTIVASSAAALVGIGVLKLRPIPLTLLTPSPDRLSDLIEQRVPSDLPARAAARTSSFFRYRPGTTELERVTVTAAEQMQAFAGPYYEQDLATLLAGLPVSRRACVAIIYGGADRRVRIAAMPELQARFPAIPMVRMDGMEHGPISSDQAADLARTVEEFTPRRCT